MKVFGSLRRVLVVLMMSLCLTCVAAPAVECYAAATQVETQVAEAEATTANEDEEVFFFLMMGGALLIILFAVTVSIATFSSSVAVAANMDVDGE